MGGETMETVKDFIFLGSKITSDSDFSHEIKRCLLLGRKAMINLDSILKSRDITLTTKDHLVKAMVFSVVMCGCSSWTIKKAERWRIDAFGQRMRWLDGITYSMNMSFEQALGVGDGQGSLVCCSPGGCKVRHDWATKLNWVTSNKNCCCSVTQSCLTLCNSMDCSIPGSSVLRSLPEFAQTHVHWVNDAI